MSDYLATADVWTVLDLIAAEFRSDPTSTACFDRRLVDRAIALTAHGHQAQASALQLLAWIGEDEHGSRRIGLKQALVPAGLIPLVVVAEDRRKIDHADLRAQLQRQADHFGKPIRLARFVWLEDLTTLPPRPQG